MAVSLVWLVLLDLVADPGLLPIGEIANAAAVGLWMCSRKSLVGESDQLHTRLLATIDQACNELYPLITPTVPTQTTPPQNTIQLLNLLKTTHATIKKQFSKLCSTISSIEINFHTGFGLLGQATSLAIPHKPHTTNANQTYPVHRQPHLPPTHLPAIGPIHRLEATQATQQIQCDLNPGKPLHFAHITSDAVGPSGLRLHLPRPFTHANLRSYHPDYPTMPESTQHKIIQAHNFANTHLTALHQRYAHDNHHTRTAWPFFYYPNHPNRYPRTTTFSARLPDLLAITKHIPTKSRYQGFTLHALARLHPTWLEFLDDLIPLILTTRLIPTTLKTTGRTLLDKPNTTDKRPLSVVQALDAHLDSIVNSHFAETIERLQIFDHSIAAYHKGHSCTDLTLNHLLAIENTTTHRTQILAQIDEDKEKYFDRISKELQLCRRRI